MGGGDRDRNRISEVLKMVCPKDQIEGCQWQEMEGQKLDNGRHFHVSIPLPESYDICLKLVEGGRRPIDRSVFNFLLSCWLFISQLLDDIFGQTVSF